MFSQKNIKKILTKLSKKVKRSPSKKKELIEVKEDKNQQIIMCEKDKEKVKLSKKKITHDSTLAESNLGKSKTRKIDIQDINFFTKLQNDDLKPKLKMT